MRDEVQRLLSRHVLSRRLLPPLCTSGEPPPVLVSLMSRSDRHRRFLKLHPDPCRTSRNRSLSEMAGWVALFVCSYLDHTAPEPIGLDYVWATRKFSSPQPPASVNPLKI